MKKNKVFTKLFSGLLIGGLLLGGSTMAMAADTFSKTTDQDNTPPQIHGRKTAGMHKVGPKLTESMLDELLADGTITSTQADAIQTKEAQLDADRQAKLVAMKDMTKEQYQAKIDAMKNMSKEQYQAKIQAMKDITKEQRQAKIEAMKAIKDKSRADRKTYRLENKTLKVDLFTQLVNDGVFTTAEADSIKEAIRTKMNEQRQADLSNGLNTLVENNTITSDQSTTIQARMTQFATDRHAEMEALKDMTPAQRDTYRHENQIKKVNPLATLVEDGTITQAQANAVFQTLRR